mgnify:CR=1 FL=1
MRASKYTNDPRRYVFRDYLLSQKKKSTALGYLSALNEESFVNEIARSKYDLLDVFYTSDIDLLKLIYNDVINDKRNKLGHNRHSAALAFYINFLNTHVWN